MADTNWTLVYRDKKNRERREWHEGACFAELPGQVLEVVNNNGAIITRVEYYLPKQYERRPHIFQNLKSPDTIAIIHDLYSDEVGINKWLLSTAESTIETGLVVASPRANGKVLVNALSFFRQFMEHQGFFPNYMAYRNIGASPLEAYVLGSTYELSMSFVGGIGRLGYCHFSGHGVMPHGAASREGWKLVTQGMESDTTLADNPFYRGRDRIMGTGKGSLPVLQAKDHKGLLDEWREVVNG